jgi:gliding motility-associated-like protein
MDGSCGITKSMIVRVLKIDYPEFPAGLVFCNNEKKAIVQVSPWLYGSGTVFTQTPLGSLGPNDTLAIEPSGSNGKFDATKSPLGSWELTVSYTNLNGCTGVSTDTIHVLETPAKPSPTEAAYCQGEAIYLNATGSYPDSMYWYNDINLTDLIGVGSPTLWGDAPDPADGPVYVWVTQNNWECVSEKVKYELPIKEAPTAAFVLTYTDTLGIVNYNVPHTQSPIYGNNPFAVNFSATGTVPSDSVWWNHHREDGVDPSWVNDGNFTDVGFTYSVANLTKEGAVGPVYVTQMIVTNEFGCSDTAEALIWSFGSEDYYNVFSPNGDGQNDIFYVKNTSLEFFKVEIFNRWGAKVYEWENDPNQGWDGGDHPDGVYFWVLKGTYVNGDEFKKQGTVTLTGRNQ